MLSLSCSIQKLFKDIIDMLFLGLRIMSYIGNGKINTPWDATGSKCQIKSEFHKVRPKDGHKCEKEKTH